MFGQMEKVYKISKENHPMIDDINQRAEFETTVNRILLPSSEEEYLSFFEEYFFLNDKHKKICSKIKKETETSFECQIDEITFLKNVNFVFDNRIALFIYKEDLFDCDIKTNKCIFLSQLGKILINLYLVYLYFNNFTLYSIITQSIFSSMEAQTRQKLKLKEKKLLSSQKSSCIYVYSQ